MDKKQIIRERILFAVFIVLVVCIFITTAVSQLYLSNLTNTLQKSVSDRIIHSAKSLAETVTKEELDQLRTEEDEGSPVFMEVFRAAFKVVKTGFTFFLNGGFKV